MSERDDLNCKVKEFESWVYGQCRDTGKLLDTLTSYGDSYDYWRGYYGAFLRVLQNFVPVVVMAERVVRQETGFINNDIERGVTNERRKI